MFTSCSVGGRQQQLSDHSYSQVVIYIQLSKWLNAVEPESHSSVFIYCTDHQNSHNEEHHFLSRFNHVMNAIQLSCCLVTNVI